MPLVLSYPWCMDETRNSDPVFAREWDADSANIERFQAGDEEAFEALVRSREREVYRTALRMLGSEDDALDASQETFIRAYRSLKSFRGEASFKTWAPGHLHQCVPQQAGQFLRTNETQKHGPDQGEQRGRPRDGSPLRGPLPRPVLRGVGHRAESGLGYGPPKALTRAPRDHRPARYPETWITAR